VPLLIRDLKFAPTAITIADFRDNRSRIAEQIKAGVKYEQDGITRDNLDAFLSARLGAGDVLLDLAWNIDCPTIIEWCRDHGVRYLNTSIELWDPYHDAAKMHPTDRTLYVRHQSIRKMIARWGSNNGPSAVVEHGANPGMVSHLTKQGLSEIAHKLLADGKAGTRAPKLEAALADQQFNQLAMLTGTKVIWHRRLSPDCALRVPSIRRRDQQRARVAHA